MTVRLFRLALLLATCLAAFASFGSPRDIATAAADLVENNYFDARRAQAIADDLRTQAAAGRFDALTDPRDLAVALTSHLKAFDHHFNVLWSGPGALSTPFLSDAMDRRLGYGLRRVEMLPGAIGLI